MSEKRTSTRLVGSVIIALIIGVVIGYAAGTSMAPGVAPTVAPTTVTETVTTTVEATPPLKKVRIAVIYFMTVEEPWVAIMHEAMTWARDNYNVDYAYTENVKEADVERVIKEYISAGYDTIFPHSWGYHPITIKVAKEFPNIAFGQGSGPPDIEYPPNVVMYDPGLGAGFEEAAYLGGIIAGKLTKTNVIGTVAGFAVPDVNTEVNAFAAGARSVNSQVKMKTIFIESWFDPVKGRDSAKALIDAGADVIYAERYGPFEAAREAMAAGKTVYCLGNYLDQAPLAPDVVVASIVFYFKPLIKELIDMRRSGEWMMPERAFTLKAGGSALVWNPEFKADLPADVIAAVDKAQADILAGTLVAPVMMDWDPKKWD